MDINRDNYENYLLLYLDRELNPAEMKSVELFLLTNPDLQKEFDLLKQTQLVPSDPVFVNKPMLLRQEEKKRIIPLFWMRMAAAVAVLILGSWLLISQLTKNSGANHLNKEELTGAKPETNAMVENSMAKDSNEDQHPLAVVSPVSEKKNKTVVLRKKKELNEPAEKKLIEEPQNNIVVTDDLDLTARKSNPELVTPSGENRNVAEPKKMTTLPMQETAALVLVADNANPPVSQYAVYKDTDIQNDNAISVLALNDRNKALTGFFKKLTKRTPTDENSKKLRVSVFQFSY